MKKMLLVFAHPDDESFNCGGLVPKYVKAGWDVDLICATRGDAGNSGSNENISKEELAKIRQKELETAGTLLGISSVTFFDYRDGTLAEEPPGELEDMIYRKMEEVVPDVVITFDTSGISNHPDHIKMCFATTFAFQKYAFWIQERLQQLPEYKEENAPKLYYACTPETVATYLKKKKVFPQESFGKPWKGVPDKFITTVISAAGFQNIKKKALRAHQTQQEDVNRFYSIATNPLAKQEYFILRMHGTREIFMGKNDRISSKL